MRRAGRRLDHGAAGPALPPRMLPPRSRFATVHCTRVAPVRPRHSPDPDREGTENSQAAPHALWSVGSGSGFQCLLARSHCIYFSRTAPQVTTATARHSPGDKTGLLLRAPSPFSSAPHPTGGQTVLLIAALRCLPCSRAGKRRPTFVTFPLPTPQTCKWFSLQHNRLESTSILQLA